MGKMIEAALRPAIVLAVVCLPMQGASACNVNFERYELLATEAAANHAPTAQFRKNAANECPSLANWMKAGDAAIADAQLEDAISAYAAAVDAADVGDRPQRAQALAKYAEALFRKGYVTPAANFARDARELDDASEQIRAIGKRIDSYVASKGLDADEVKRSLLADFPRPRFAARSANATAAPDDAGSRRNPNGGAGASQRSSTTVGLGSGTDRISDTRVTFQYSRKEIDEASRANLDLLIGILRAAENANRKFVLEAHSDERGDAQFNWRLSADRANFVFDEIVRRAPELRGRIATRGVGEDNPRYKNARDEEEHRLNRRLEVVIE